MPTNRSRPAGGTATLNTSEKLQPDLLQAYLKRAGLGHLSDLPRQVETDTEARLKLERTLLSHRSELPISPDPEEMAQFLRFIFGQSSDVIIRYLQCGTPPTRALLVHIAAMADAAMLERAVSVLLNDLESGESPTDSQRLVDWLAHRRMSVAGTEVVTSLDKCLRGLLNGDSVIFLTGSECALQLPTPGWNERAIKEPDTESVVRGPREGLVETVATNRSLVRRRVRDERLRFETIRSGEITQTEVCLIYISGLCKDSLVAEVRSRLQRIKKDAIIDSGYIEELIEDTPFTVFPLLKSTERPDVVAAALTEGRCALLVDGSPFALIAPTSLIDHLQAAEDFYERFPVSTFVRALRWLFVIVALIAPSLYVALTTFHQEMLPTPLLLSIMAAREGVPFPAVVEALLMEISFEALREAGVRLPRPVGQAISIVGALVIGEAAVQAGIVSALMVIVVAITGIASFIIPKPAASSAFRVLRFPMLLLAGTFGAFGITIGVVAILIHLISLRSFGEPYYSPLGPWLPADHGDVIMRAPHWSNRTRPAGTESYDPVRTKEGLKPGPQHQEGETP